MRQAQDGFQPSHAQLSLPQLPQPHPRSTPSPSAPRSSWPSRWPGRPGPVVQLAGADDVAASCVWQTQASLVADG